ncbi:MAG: peptidylprolyl isomerase [Myxococcota bacterium]
MITKDKVVSLRYVLRNAAGETLEESKPERPLVYLHGHRNVIPGLERQLEGKAVGDTLVAVVPPAEGYGEKQKVKSLRLPKSKFQPGMSLGRGEQFFMQRPDGRPLPLWIEKVQGNTVVATPQHPMAGLELHFDVEILEIRDATAEEIQEGHVQGPDDHDHGEADEG